MVSSPSCAKPMEHLSWVKPMGVTLREGICRVDGVQVIECQRCVQSQHVNFECEALNKFPTQHKSRQTTQQNTTQCTKERRYKAQQWNTRRRGTAAAEPTKEGRRTNTQTTEVTVTYVKQGKEEERNQGTNEGRKRNWPGKRPNHWPGKRPNQPHALGQTTINTGPKRVENRTFQKCFPSPLESIKNNCNWPGKRPNHWPGKRPNQPPALRQTTIDTGPKRVENKMFQKCFPSPLESIKNNCNWPGKRPNHWAGKRPNQPPANHHKHRPKTSGKQNVSKMLSVTFGIHKKQL